MPDAKAVEALLLDPLGFMQNNLVLPGLKGTSNLRWLTLDRVNYDAKTADGRIIPYYHLVEGKEGPGCFQAFWCDYDNSATKSVTVDSRANLMFTAAMNGCSLGVGSKVQSTGTRLVSHANCTSIGSLISDLTRDPQKPKNEVMINRVSQQLAQTAILRMIHKYDPNLEIIAPPHYRIDEKARNQVLHSTTFGVRDWITNDWAFYVQKRGDYGGFDRLVSVMFVAGVRPFAISSPCIIL